MNSILEIDKASREKIKTEIHKNFFVEAGAGSGKTFSLVQRMVAMVKGGFDVKKICAITFTKAAAGEFYNRFYRALNDELQNDIPDSEKALIETAVQNIDLCFMGTIDSFCNMILSEHPVEAGIPSDAAVKSDAEIANILVREYTEIAKGNYSAELKEKYDRFVSFVSNPKEIYTGGIARILNTRNAELQFEKQFCGSVDEHFKSQKSELLRLLDTVERHPETIYASSRGDSEKYINQFNDYKIRSYTLKQNWDRNLADVMYVLNSLKGFRLTPECCLETDFPDFLEPHMTKSKVSWLDFVNPIYDELCEIRYSAVMDFLVSASKEISDKLRREGCLSFFDYLLYLRDMLRNDVRNGGRLIEHINGRHSYYLIDEFQDTDPLQAEIFFYLTAKNPVENWKECQPKQGSLFIVGDPKQSIYRFRNADVSSFLSVKSMFENGVGEVLQLCRNFRSTKGICEYFNSVFEILLPEDTEIQSRFSPIPCEENRSPEGTFGGIYSYPVPTSRTPDYAIDAESVCQIIESLVHNPNHKIMEKDDSEPREIEYGDFMIITPGKTHIADYVAAMSARKIPSKVEGKVAFSDCTSLIAITKIYSAVANPADSIKIFGALTCGIFGITENDISAFVSDGGKLNLFAENDIENSQKICDIISSLKSIYFSAKNLSPVTVLDLLQKKFRIFEKTGADNLECYYYALELLRKAESDNTILSHNDAVEYLHEIITNASGEERCISLKKESNRVHIANLHKVKGLEAPIVILASPASKAPTPEIRIADTPDGKKSWLFSLGKMSTIKTELFDEEKELEKDCLLAEKVRLLYVAATRARSVLIISNAVKASDGNRSESNPWYTLLDDNVKDIFSAISKNSSETEPSEVQSISALIDEAKNDSISDNAEWLEKSFEIKRPSQIKIKSKTSSEDEFEDSEDETARAENKTNAALRGTLVHRLMEVLVSSRGKIPVNDAVDEIITDYDIYDSRFRDILLSVGNTVMSGGYEQNNGMVKDIFAELMSADEVFCEVPFCRSDSSTLWHGVMDVVYCKNGEWHIVDYKTNTDADDLDEKYQEQLSAYIEAFRELTGNTADAMIYHIDV